MRTDTLKMIRDIVVIIGMIIYFVMWCRLPQVVGIHFGISCVADAYGNKMIFLPMILLPLLSYLPMSDTVDIEIHAPGYEELSKEFMEDEKKKGAIRQLVIGCIFVGVDIFLLILAMSSVK